MPIRHWQASDFTTKEAIAKYRAVYHDHWTYVARCWFWLLGPGRTCPDAYIDPGHGRRYDAIEERRIAERERIRHGWTLETLQAAHDLAISRQRDKKAPVVFQTKKRQPARSSAVLDEDDSPAVQWVPGPTVERDWPETWDISTEKRREMWFNAIHSKPGVRRGSFGLAAAGIVEQIDTTSRPAIAREPGSDDDWTPVPDPSQEW